MHKITFFRTGAAAFTLLFVLTAGLGAQHADWHTDQQTDRLADGDSEGVDVIVTAARTEESELSTPAHITVITAQEIAESGEQSLVGILDKMAGVNFTSYSGPQQAQIDMRGFGENSHGRVLVMVDGRRLNSQDMSGIQWLSIPLESIERVEVVHGSNSVMYGNHAVGGVVNIITKDSRERAEFASTIDFGTYNSSEFNKGIFSSQRIRYGTNQGATDGSVTFSHSTNEGHRDRTESRAVNTLLNGGWDITEILRAEADLGYQWNEYQMPGALTEAQYESDPSQATNDADQAEEHDLSAFLSMEWFPLYNTEVNLDGGYRYQAQAHDTESFGSYSNRVYNTFEASPKAIIEGEFGSLPWQLVTGIDVFYSAQEIADYFDKERENKNYSADLSLNSIGAYFHPTLSLTDKISAETGVRYERTSIIAVKDSSAIDDKDIHQVFVYNAAININPAENIKLFAKGETLYRYPFTDEQAVITGYGSDGFNTDLRPEKGVNAEIGTRIVQNDLFKLSLNGYFLQMDDEIVWYDEDGMFGPLPGKNINQDKTRRWGVDTELTTRLYKVLTLSVGYSFLDARFIEGDNEGNAVPLVPAHSANGKLTVQPVKKFSFSSGVSFTGEQYQSGDNSNSMDPIDEYWIFDIEASYTPHTSTGQILIKVKAENILNEIFPAYATYDTYYPAPGRSLSISASYSY